MTDAYDVLRLVAEATGQSPGRICGGFQTHADAEARHLCWYLCHTALGMRQIDIGNWFGVDRRAVAYGIGRVEDKRDAPAFDTIVEKLEGTLK
jgi:chromosomal replication initiation ATPase DnaA